MCWGYLTGINEIISLPWVVKPSFLELVLERSNEILTVFWKSYIEYRPEIKSKKHDRAVYCLSRLTKVLPLIDLIWLDWWATPLFWKLERIIHFKSSHPPKTHQTHQIELLMLSGPQSSEHKCQQDYQPRWRSNTLTWRACSEERNQEKDSHKKHIHTGRRRRRKRVSLVTTRTR